MKENGKRKFVIGAERKNMDKVVVKGKGNEMEKKKGG